MTTPNAMPKKFNALHQQILSGLLATKPASWDRKTLVKDADGKETVVKTKILYQSLPHTTRKEVQVKNVRRGPDGVYKHDLVEVDVPVPTLAGNVSNQNLEIIAARWLK